MKPEPARLTGGLPSSTGRNFPIKYNDVVFQLSSERPFTRGYAGAQCAVAIRTDRCHLRHLLSAALSTHAETEEGAGQNVVGVEERRLRGYHRRDHRHHHGRRQRYANIEG